MSTIEERVTVLEERVERLAFNGQHTHDVAVVAARDALTAREAHQRNIELLNALRKTQMEHTQTLAEHGRVLAEHTGRMNSIDGRMDSIDGKLGQLTLGMHTIESLLRRLVNESGDDKA